MIDGIQQCSDIQCDIILPRHGDTYEYLREHFTHIKVFNYFTSIRTIGNKRHFDIVRRFWNYIISLVLSVWFLVKGYDLIISNSAAVDVGASAALRIKKSHLYYIREFVREDINCEFINELKFKKNLENSEFVVYISKAIEMKYEAQYNTHKILTIHDGIVVNDYTIMPHKLFDDDVLKLVQVGLLSDGKGAFDTIQMMQKLRELDYSRFTLEFVGNGNEQYISKLKKFVAVNGLSDVIFFTGYCDDIKTKLDKKDIVIMNSRNEGLGRVTIEGMLTGCLVIGRNSGGTAELIRNYRTGFLYDDDNEFYQVINYVTKNKETCKLIAEQGQKWASNEFDHVEMAKEFLKFVHMM